MVRSLVLVISVLVSVLPLDASACSLAPGYRMFDLNSDRLSGSGPAPATPRLSVRSIKRGIDDGDYSSCSDAGILVISIDDPEAAKNIGFLFESESGRFPDKVLPDEIIAPIELADSSLGFRFVWLDIASGQKLVEPIDVNLSVRAVSPTLVEGEKVILDIRDP